MAAPFTVDDTLVRVVRPAVLWWDGATVGEAAAHLDQTVHDIVAAVVAAPPAETQTVREMYRRIGLDPTKTRPSNEALLRRVRRGDPFPRVNALVDAVNLCSLELQLPYGVYDRRAISGPIVLRLGREGEAYDGIRKDAVHVGGRVTVADDHGPFGNPTSDSARAMVTAAATEALVVVYAPASTTPQHLAAVLDRTAALVTVAVGGRETARWIA
jgi:DNA/RNA-binding domain of Phe-tRNA-synthetase-like protein